MSTSLFPRISRVAYLLYVIGWLLFIPSVAVMLYWGFDRTPPFELLNYTPGKGRPGDTIIIYGKVHRDLDRSCSVSYSRYFYDGAGNSFELNAGPQTMNADALSALNAITPDGIRLAIPIPRAAVPGPSKVLVSLDYSCNVVHKFFPISVLVAMNVYVDSE